MHHFRSFQDVIVPRGCRPAGWAFLVGTLEISAPVRTPSCISEAHVKGSRQVDETWTVFDKRYWPGEKLTDHLTFALRHETMDLLILKWVLEALPVGEMENLVGASPTGRTVRRAWYFYELLTGRTLAIEDAPKAPAVDLLDPDAYFTGKPRLSKRHRVRDNLLGTAEFCPLIRRTAELERLTRLDLADRAREAFGRSGVSLVARAASILLLADSRASFAIEGERPRRSRLERWGRAVLQTGRNALTLDEIVRLHGVLIEDSRFVAIGLRPDGVFLGERDQEGDPLPEFAGARPADLSSLLQGLLGANGRMQNDRIDAVLQAAATAFGFLYVHPLQDGNGRLHRCLIHHVLAGRGFTPPSVVFPLSAVMLDRLHEYRATLEGHSAPLMPFIEWRPTPERNVEVLNDTADLYRYFDCTGAAEFLYRCVARTVEHDLPREVEYLRRHDEAMRGIAEIVEIPDRVAENLLRFIRQNQGRLPKGRRTGEYQLLTDEEVVRLEGVVGEAFAGFE